jgi:hypothetical protein
MLLSADSASSFVNAVAQQICLMLAFCCYHPVRLNLLLKISTGYLGDKESTSEVLDSEGWLRTGDVCMIGKDGFLFVVDRMKELIKYNGYQVPAIILNSLITASGSGEGCRLLT